MKLAEIREAKMPGIMKRLIMDLSRVVPWPFKRLDLNSKNLVAFDAREPYKLGSFTRPSQDRFVLVKHIAAGDRTAPWLIVQTAGPQSDEVIKLAKIYRAESDTTGQPEMRWQITHSQPDQDVNH